MLVRIESGLKTVMQAFRVFDTEGRPVKFKNSIKYFELDEENVKKLKELKLDEKYDGKIKIEYDVEKDTKKDKKDLEVIKKKEEFIEELNKEMQELTDELAGKELKDIKEEYKEYLPAGKTKKEDIITGIVDNVFKEKQAEIEAIK